MRFKTNFDKMIHEDSYKKRIEEYLDTTHFKYDEVKVVYIEHQDYTYVQFRLGNMYADFDCQWQTEHSQFMNGEFLTNGMLYCGIAQLNKAVNENE